MNFKLLVTVLFLQCLAFTFSLDSQLFSYQSDGRPDFCRDRQCPPFELKSTVKNDYTVRVMEKSQWAISRTNKYTLEKAKLFLLRRLFKYIAGFNKPNIQLNFTTPVLFKLIKGPDYGYLNDYQMSLYIPNSVANPPEPQDKSVQVIDVPQFTVFVRSFPGFIRNKFIWVDELEKLHKALDRDNKSYDSSYFYAVTYDGPYDVTNRHNEVWVVQAK